MEVGLILYWIVHVHSYQLQVLCGMYLKNTIFNLGALRDHVVTSSSQDLMRDLHWTLDQNQGQLGGLFGVLKVLKMD